MYFQVESEPSTLGIICSRNTTIVRSSALPTSGPLTYMCELCDKSFPLKQDLALHKHHTHGLQLLQAPLQHFEVERKTPDMPALSPVSAFSGSAVSGEEKQGKDIETQTLLLPEITSEKERDADLSEETEDPLESESGAFSPTPPSELSDSVTTSLEPNQTDSEASASTELGSCRTRGVGKSLSCDVCTEKFFLAEKLEQHKSKHKEIEVPLKEFVVHEKTSAAPQTETQHDERKSRKRNHSGKSNISEAGSSDEVVTRSRKVRQLSITSNSSESIVVPVTTPELGAEPVKYDCEICFRVFRSWLKLVDHCKNIHDFTPKSLSPVNEVPDLTNIESEPQKQSMSTPTADNKIECSFCHSRYKSNHSLIVHCRNHHGKLCCTECIEFYDCQDELDDHLLVHELQENLNPKSGLRVPIENTTKLEIKPEYLSPKKALVGDRINCLYCYTTCTELSEIAEHCKKEHKLLSCNQCLNAFPTEDELKDHQQFQHVLGKQRTGWLTSAKNFAARCEICGNRWKSRTSYFSHVISFHKKSPCRICLKTFTNKELEGHKRNCKETYWKCYICDEILKNGKLLSVHMNEHRDDTKPDNAKAVEISDDSVSDDGSVFMESNNKNNTPSCKYCNKLFDSNQTLLLHLKQNHSGEPQFYCETCDTVYYHLQHYKTHVLKHDKVQEITEKEKSSEDIENDERFLAVNTTFVPQCQLCKKTFNNWPNAGRHIREVHVNVKSFRCNYCSRAFLNKENLEFHKSVHDKQRFNYSCCYCDRVFESKRRHKLHMKSHNQKKTNKQHISATIDLTDELSKEDKEFQLDRNSPAPQTTSPAIVLNKIPSTAESIKKCNFCSVEVKTMIELKSHLNTEHPFNMYYPCQKCDTICYDMESYTKHSFTHQSTKCRFCTRIFYTETELRSHENSCSQKSTNLKSAIRSRASDLLLGFTLPDISRSVLLKHSSDQTTRSKEETCAKPVAVEQVKKTSPSRTQSFKTPPAQTNKSQSALICSFCDAEIANPNALIKHLQEHANMSC